MSDSQSSSEEVMKTYYLRLNWKPADSAVEYELSSKCRLPDLLAESRELFSKDAKTPITCAYTENGKLIKRLSDVPDGSVIVLSFGEQFYGKKFYLLENGNLKNSRGNGYKPSYRSNGNLDRLLTDATSLLKLSTPARIAYTKDGKRIYSINDASPEKVDKLLASADNGKIAIFENLPEESVLVISTGGNFVSLMSAKERQQKLQETVRNAKIQFDKQSYQPSENQNIDARSTKSSMTQITIEHAEKSRYARYHQLLAVLPGSVEDHIRDSMIATYVSLPEDVRAGLESRETYETLLRQTQIHLFTEQLIHQMICQQRSSSPIDEEVTKYSLDLIDELSMNDIHFEIMGHRYSGKTMLLSSIASVLYRKILVSDARDCFLMFPINMSLHALHLDSPFQIYPTIVNIVFNSVRYCRFDLLPFLLNLRQWFLLAPTVGSMTKLPAELATMPSFDFEAISSLGKRFHALFHSNSIDNAKFLEMIFRFPNEIARAVGMKSAVYIIDHVDCATPEAMRAILSVIAPKSKKDFVPFVVASQNDAVYKKKFNLTATQLDTNGAIDISESEIANTEIFVADLNLKLRAVDMMGCPGFIVAFANLCQIVEKDFNMSEKASLKGAKYSQITPKIAAFRRAESDQEFRKLALSLALAKCEVIEFDTLNRMDEEDSLLIKIINRTDKKSSK